MLKNIVFQPRMIIVDASSSIPKHLIRQKWVLGDFRFMQQAEIRIFSSNSFWVMWSVIISSECHANHGIACQITGIFAPKARGSQSGEGRYQQRVL